MNLIANAVALEEVTIYSSYMGYLMGCVEGFRVGCIDGHCDDGMVAQRMDGGGMLEGGKWEREGNI